MENYIKIELYLYRYLYSYLPWALKIYQQSNDLYSTIDNPDYLWFQILASHQNTNESSHQGF